MIINTPFKPNGEVHYEKYSVLESLIREFDNVEIIGQDSSKQYNVYKIEMGTKNKPTLFFTAVMHGTEYAGAHYLLAFLKDIRERKTLPNSFIDELLNNFRIVAVPVLNPYGLNKTTKHAVTLGRHPIHGKEQNWDWNENRFNLVESQNVKHIADDPHIFAYMDFHLIRSYKTNNAVILGHGKSADVGVRNDIVETMEKLFPNKKVVKWQGSANKNSGLSRSYMATRENLYTKNTLSYINEMGRPVQESQANGGFNEPLNPKELFEAGYYMAYLFTRTSMDYYYQNKGTGTYAETHNLYEGYPLKVDTPEKTVNIEVDSNNDVVKTIENYKVGKYKNKKIISDILRDSKDRIIKIKRNVE